jgi:hypothetical protein
VAPFGPAQSPFHIGPARERRVRTVARSWRIWRIVDGSVHSEAAFLSFFNRAGPTPCTASICDQSRKTRNESRAAINRCASAGPTPGSCSSSLALARLRLMMRLAESCGATGCFAFCKEFRNSLLCDVVRLSGVSLGSNRSARFFPMTRARSSTVRSGRAAMIFCAAAGPMPGSFSNSSALARLGSRRAGGPCRASELRTSVALPCTFCSMATGPDRLSHRASADRQIRKRTNLTALASGGVSFKWMPLLLGVVLRVTVPRNGVGWNVWLGQPLV